MIPGVETPKIGDHQVDRAVLFEIAGFDVTGVNNRASLTGIDEVAPGRIEPISPVIASQ